MKYQKIGMRIIKTAIAVFISISIYIVLLLINKCLGIDSNNKYSPTNLYTPFFAAIAAAYALHRNRKSSLEQAKIRSVGSVIGGYYGMIIILISEYIMMDLMNLHNTHFILFKTITYIIVSLGVIPLIWFTVFIKQKTSVFITLLTYFSVTISIRNNLESVAMFATNRVISTLVGIGISLLINNISLIRRKNKNILFVSSIDDNILNNSSNDLSPYIKYKLDNLYYKNMALTFMTTRTMSSLKHLFEEVDVNFPMVVMNGSAIYDFKTHKYSAIYNISNSSKEILEEIIEKLNISAFRYSIEDNMLNCFYDKLINSGEIEYYNMCKEIEFDHFVRAKIPSDGTISLYAFVEEKEVIDAFINEINKNNYLNDIDYIVYPYKEINNVIYYYLKINSKHASKENLIEKIKVEGNFDKVVVCGSGVTDIPVIKTADFSFCLSDANIEITNNVDVVIGNNPEEIFKLFDRIYHSYDVDSEIKAIKRKYNKK